MSQPGREPGQTPGRSADVYVKVYPRGKVHVVSGWIGEEVQTYCGLGLNKIVPNIGYDGIPSDEELCVGCVKAISHDANTSSIGGVALSSARLGSGRRYYA